jgi:KaiC/GvpD/RAD55 family RecA-like ATPase
MGDATSPGEPMPPDDDGWWSNDDDPGHEYDPWDDHGDRWANEHQEIAGLIDKLSAAIHNDGPPTVRFVQWDDLWDKERTADDWLYPQVFARGRGHAIYAIHKAGKSLFTLAVAAELATGPEPVAVVYLDYEMTEDDLRDRLEDMGYGPDTDMGRFHYALLPTLPPLDTAHGGEALDQVIETVQAEHPDHHLFVVIDTTSRAVHGDENDADTYQDFYRFTGIRLKRRAVTWARLDHAGKDATRGQRGSSAKGDDVDLVWKLEPADNGIALRRELSRIAWAREKVTFARTLEPLRYRQAVTWAAGTQECARILDEIGYPVDGSGNGAVKALRDAKEGRARDIVLDAVRYRRDTAA